MGTYGEIEVWLHAFLILALKRKEWSSSRLCRFNLLATLPSSVHNVEGWLWLR
jgi:hypothetical protein